MSDTIKAALVKMGKAPHLMTNIHGEFIVIGWCKAYLREKGYASFNVEFKPNEVQLFVFVGNDLRMVHALTECECYASAVLAVEDAVMPERCCICGRFMSDDDCLLGCQRSEDDAYAHPDCVKKSGGRIEDA